MLPEDNDGRAIPYERSHPHQAIYLALRTVIAAHIQSGQEPLLSKTLPPKGGTSWVPHEEVVRHSHAENDEQLLTVNDELT